MGDTTATVLYTKEDEVMATRDTHREKGSSGSSRYAKMQYAMFIQDERKLKSFWKYSSYPAAILNYGMSF